jgi:hypothetical protein
VSARFWVAGLGAVLLASLAINGYLLIRVPPGLVIVPPERLVELARDHFPSEYRSAISADQKLAFEKTFPVIKGAAPRGMGSSCFTEESGVHGQFCVVYAVLDS